MSYPQLPPDLPAWQKLTCREWEVLLLLADDLSNEQLMVQLCIERKSVENYKSQIGDKVGTSGRDALNRYARQNRSDLAIWYPILCRQATLVLKNPPPV